MDIQQGRTLDGIVARLPQAYPGPGGAVAVVQQGRVLVRHAWGMADPARRLPFTTETVVPVCSVTKQFTCALMLALHGDAAALDGDVRAALPGLAGPVPTAAQLAANQSGIRDYWALTVLCGADPEGVFTPADAAAMTAAVRSLQFAPGTRYAYSNLNFRILGDILERRAGLPLGELLADRILAPAGMETARWQPDTSLPLPGGAVGHEGTAATGFFPAVNRIHWSGDAGLCASLEDMIAWERQIDRTRDDPASLYARLSAPVAFGDGRPARYGMGLARTPVLGRIVTGHGGALRGWRIRRLHVAAARLSVVVLFNHDHDAHAAALSVLAAALGVPEPSWPSDGDAADHAGNWFDAETGLVLTARAEGGRVLARFGGAEAALAPAADGIARSLDMTLRRQGDDLHLDRPGDNLGRALTRLDRPQAVDLAGRYRSDELDATLDIDSFGGVYHAGFTGRLGQGAWKPLQPAGGECWIMPDPRAMDSAPPGAWTLRLRREGGRVAGVTAGCYIARGVDFRRIG